MDEEDEVLDYALTKDILKDALRHFFPNEPDFDWDIKVRHFRIAFHARSLALRSTRMASSSFPCLRS